MNAFRSLIILVTVLTSFASGGEVTFKNNTRKSFYVYLRAPKSRVWAHRTTLVRPNQQTNSRVRAGSYIVHLEYPDGSSLSYQPRRLGDVAHLKINFEKQTKQISRPRTVQIPYTRPDGTTGYRTEMRTETRAIDVVAMSASDGSESQSPTETDADPGQRQQLGLTVHKCDEGIHIDAVEPGSPASQCLDTFGNRVTLVKDDHVIQINGMIPRTLEAFLQQVANGPANVQLLVKRKSNGKLVRVTADLRAANGMRRQANFPNRRLLGIAVHKCDTGIHVDEVEPGSAATRLLHENGNLFRLQPGQHILSINGIAPNSGEEFKRILQSSEGAVKLRVLGKDNATVYRLHVTP